MKAHAGGDDEDAFVPQGSQGPARGEVQGRIEASIDRHFHDGDIGVGKGDLQRYEDAMVQATGGIDARRKACGRQKAHGLLGELWRTWYVKLQTIGVFWEAVIIEHEIGLRSASQSKTFGLPMARDHQDRRGTLR